MGVGVRSAERADLLEAAEHGRGMHWEGDGDDAAVKALALLAAQKEPRLRGVKDVQALIALTRRLPFFRMFSEQALGHLCQVHLGLQEFNTSLRIRSVDDHLRAIVHTTMPFSGARLCNPRVSMRVLECAHRDTVDAYRW